MESISLRGSNSVVFSRATGSVFISLIISFICGIWDSGSSQETKEAVARFHLFYGNDPKQWKTLLEEIGPGSIVAFDTRVLNSEMLSSVLQKITQQGGRSIAYLSIGELHESETAQFEKVLEGHDSESLSKIYLNRNETFQSYRVDVRSRAWQEWILKQVRELMAIDGIGGIFLDTVDTVDLYITRQDWPLPRRYESVEAIISLIRDIKKTAGKDSFILQNGGLNLLGEKIYLGNKTGRLFPGLRLDRSHAQNPDGLLWENAFSVRDQWVYGRLNELKRIQKAGRTTVFALGYPGGSWIKSEEKFYEISRENGFISAWGQSSETLHLRATRSQRPGISETQLP